ncbi:MAG: protein phosphatase 2C domain-containing protein [Dermatophilaceae bacterium]
MASTCPACGAARAPDALFCEECGFDIAGGDTQAAATPASETQTRQTPGRAQTAAAGEESPLDVGWTGPVARGPVVEVDGAPETCTVCEVGTFEDGYCNNCGAKRPDPRDHFTEAPAPWVGGVCDIGRRHTRNEDAMALHASQAPLSYAALVVCDGVSNSSDSHLASLAAARAARDVLDDPLPRGMGLRDAVIGSIEAQLANAVQRARDAVVLATPDVDAANPPSCTLVAALVDEGIAVVGNVGDSRAYWLPDAPESAPRQLSTDDSFSEERMREGMPRTEAETGPQAHAITRWLGVDSPEDLRPHTGHVDLTEDGWLLVCSDGLWNYCSEAGELRKLVSSTAAALGPSGREPLALAQALTDFANDQGGADNITVALARVGTPPRTTPAPDEGPAAAVTPTGTMTPASTGEDSPDGTVRH